MPIPGKGDLRIKIGSQEAVHPMWVADIQDECILIEVGFSGTPLMCGGSWRQCSAHQW